MPTFATIIAFVVAAPIAVVTAVFGLEVFAGIWPANRAKDRELDKRSATVIIPAHDEAAIIVDTLTALKAVLPADCELLLVAHNCTDDTASLARSAGVKVVERRCQSERGKGFALAAAREALRDQPPDVVIVIDADCRINRYSLIALIDAAATTCRPVQSTNVLAPDLGASPLVQLSSFAFFLKNSVRQLGLKRLGGAARLTGTGMAFPWLLFDRAQLATANVVEDLALGLEVARSGSPPLFVPQAIVASPAATTSRTLVQRERWEGGHFSTLVAVAPGLLMQALVKRDWATFAAALDLAVPPLAMLALFNLAAISVSFAALLLGGSWLPLALLVAVLGLAGVGVAMAWAIEGRRFASAAALVRVPYYILWKVPMYLRLARRGAPKDWLRTGR